MRQKMINLCPTTYEIARKMPNFSEWVRRKLLKHPMHIDWVDWNDKAKVQAWIEENKNWQG